MGQLGLYFDMTRCTGCRCCQIACKDKNDLPVGTLFREVSDFEGGVFPQVWAASLSMACNHCMEPQCAQNCPVAAYSKDPETGLVLQDTWMCIGCKRCTLSCPYGAPAYNPIDDTVRKCNGCIDWLQNGLQPACVGACSTRALQFGDIDELRSRFGQRALSCDAQGLPDSELTHPNVLIACKDQMRP